MTRNIILCSDGTGNKGGYGDDTNVFKLYKAVKIHELDSSDEQLVFYNDGVGTSENKYWRAITSAFGFGFSHNVKQLYRFLALNYRPGDRVYLFGFSRGAATVRAFAGMLTEVGLIDLSLDVNNGSHDNPFREAWNAYRRVKRRRKGGKNWIRNIAGLIWSKPSIAEGFRENRVHKDESFAPDGRLKIECVGVWDTVSALGFPQDWSIFFEYFFLFADAFFDLFLPHNFYDFQLDDNVTNAYHAISIDDERRTFHPILWDESARRKPRNIEQVWFSGVHSNVGGGYPRSELSNVTLDWMLKRVTRNGNGDGIYFKDGYLDEVRHAANVNGELFNSRQGAAIYYRYEPRNISKLSKGNVAADKIKIHNSVFERMELETDDYAPGFLPQQFQISYSDLAHINGSRVDCNVGRKAIQFWKFLRKGLYRIFVEFTLILAASIIWFGFYPPVPPLPSEIGKAIGGQFFASAGYFLIDILPNFFQGFLTYALILKPNALWLVIFAVILLLTAKLYLRNRYQGACEKARAQTMQCLPANDLD